MKQDILPYLIYLYRKLSKLALIGLSLILCAFALFIFDKVIQQQKVENLKSELMTLNSANQSLTQKAIVQQSSSGIGDVLDLREKTEMLATIELIQSTAKKNDIYVDNIDYQFSMLPLVHAASYEVSFPANGKYLDFRRFLRQLTQDYDGIILQHVEFSRNDNQVNELDGLLKLMIYVDDAE
jgi:hypothetical protein